MCAIEDPCGEEMLAQKVAHALLRVVADLPGQLGRIRAARIVRGFSVPVYADQEFTDVSKYRMDGLDWKLSWVIGLVDALIEGELIAQGRGPRPTLSLTRQGFIVLDHLDGERIERVNASEVTDHVLLPVKGEVH